MRLCELVRDVGPCRVIGPVYDGETAVAVHREARPDAAIIDVSLPGISGVEVVRAIRAVDAACVLVVLTEHDEASLRERCVALGANHFLSKSSGLDEVERIVASLIASARRGRGS